MKIVKFFAFLSIALLVLQACNKAGSSELTDAEYAISTSTQAIDAVVDNDKTYRITLPSSVSGYTVTSGATHSSVSKIVTTGTGAEVYEYTPAQEYVGPDAITIIGSDTTNGDSNNGECKKGHKKNGQAPAKQVRQQRININMTVNSPAISS